MKSFTVTDITTGKYLGTVRARSESEALYFGDAIYGEMFCKFPSVTVRQIGKRS